MPLAQFTPLTKRANLRVWTQTPTPTMMIQYNCHLERRHWETCCLFHKHAETMRRTLVLHPEGTEKVTEIRLHGFVPPSHVSSQICSTDVHIHTTKSHPMWCVDILLQLKSLFWIPAAPVTDIQTIFPCSVWSLRVGAFSPQPCCLLPKKKNPMFIVCMDERIKKKPGGVELHRLDLNPPIIPFSLSLPPPSASLQGFTYRE